MKGAVGFLVGIIGLCFFAAVSMLVPMFLGPRDGSVILVIIAVVAFVFLNVLVIGFYRMIGHLHDTVLYPDDPYTQPLRGRGLFFTGYIGLLVTLVFVVLIALSQTFPGVRIRGRQIEIVLFIAWFVGWAFTGCMLGGILMLFHDVHHKAYYRTMAPSPRDGYDDDFDISRRGPRRRPHRAEDEEERPRQRQWEE